MKITKFFYILFILSFIGIQWYYFVVTSNNYIGFYVSILLFFIILLTQTGIKLEYERDEEDKKSSECPIKTVKDGKIDTYRNSLEDQDKIPGYEPKKPL